MKFDKKMQVCKEKEVEVNTRIEEARSKYNKELEEILGDVKEFLIKELKQFLLEREKYNIFLIGEKTYKKSEIEGIITEINELNTLEEYERWYFEKNIDLFEIPAYTTFVNTIISVIF